MSAVSRSFLICKKACFLSRHSGACVHALRHESLFGIGPKLRECSTLSDAALYQQFNSIGNKLRIVTELAFNDLETVKLVKLQEKKVVPSDDLFNAVLLYISLQNPLLSKYNFDIYEFIKGARYACEAVTRAVGSSDFNGLSDTAQQSASLDYLRETVSAIHVYVAEEKRKHRKLRGQTSTLKEFELLSITLLDVSIQIVPAQTPVLQQLVLSVRAQLTALLQAAHLALLRLIGQSEDEVASVRRLIDQRPRETALSAYPVGAVVASVEVRCGQRDKYLVVRSSPPTSSSSTASNTSAFSTATTGVDVGAGKHTDDDNAGAVEAARRKGSHSEEVESIKEVTYTFRGCISGQVPLRWMMVAMNGLGGRNSKY